MESSEHRRLGALLAAHKSKKAHDAYLRQAAAAELAKRRPGGGAKMIKRHPKVKATDGYDLGHLEF